MPSQNQTFRLVFDGGWATDFGSVAEVGLSEQGLVRVPFLVDNLNNFFELDGGVHKIGGTARMNSTVIESGEEVRALFDYWKSPSNSPTQKIVVAAGTNYEAADLDGDFTTEIKTDVTDDSVVSFETFDDLLIIANDSSDSPVSWDQSSLTDPLSGSPPAFSFCEKHKNRLWAAGVAANPSHLYYSSFVDPEDWTGAGSGFIQIDPNDGDAIMGLASHKNDLWVFKGPYKGSIHRISGSAPTGGDSFARTTFVRGIGAVGHNTIFRYKDDLGFMWVDGSIHSLAATAAFGDYIEASLSRPINGWIRDRINGTRLKYAWAAVDVIRGYVLFSIPVDTATNNNHHLLMDYRFNPVRWAHWDAFSSGSIASVVDSGVPVLFDGSNDGYVRRLQRNNRNIDTISAIEGRMLSPFLHFGDPHKEKYLERASIGLSPKGNADVIFAWTRDANPEQTQTEDQGATGGALGSFVLDTSVLGGSTFFDRFMATEEGGAFRALQVGARNLDINEDLEVHSFSVTIHPGADSGEN